MTKVGRIFEQEMQKKFQQEKQEVLKTSFLAIARNLLEQGLSINAIQTAIPDLTYDEIASLK